MRSKQIQQVAVLVESSNEYGRGILRGVASYVRTHGDWAIQLPEMGRGGPLPAWLAEWRGDGILARIENPEIAAAVLEKDVPTVDLSAGRLVPNLPWVEVEEASVAKIAVEHLVGRGFQNLAFCADERFPWSKLRGEAFAAEAESQGYRTSIFAVPRTGDSQAALSEWLVSQPRPLGILACFDRLGREVLEACRNVDLPVPEEVAVLGVDDEELLCDFADPPLSSIDLNGHATGHLGAELLAALMSGQDVPTTGHFVPAVGMTQRRSTDVLAIEDPILARALNFIHHHACEGISVTDLLRALPVSRRSLEIRFRERLGRSPHQEILRVRVERIRKLLLNTDLSIAEIASRTGIRHVEYLTVLFKRAMGVTPSAFRESAGG